MERAFDPDWVSMPNCTLLDIMEERGTTVDELAAALGRDANFAQRLMGGQETFTREVANGLEALYGASAQFWINRQANYDSDFARLVEKLEKTGKPYYVITKDRSEKNWRPESKTS